MEKEPVLTIGVVTTLVTALIGMAVQFGAPIDDGLKDAITGVVIAAWPIVTLVWARSRVVSPATDAARSRTAYNEGLVGLVPSVPVDPPS